MAAINTFYRNYDISDNTSIIQGVSADETFPSPSSLNWSPPESWYFKGWSEYRDNTSVLYQPGDNFQKDEGAYYAVWIRYLSKIKLNGIEYNIKDAIAREQLSDIVFVTFTDRGRDYIQYEADMTYLECLSALNNGKKLIGVITNRYYNSKTFAFCRKPVDRIDELYFYYQSIDYQIGKITYDNNNNITPGFINIPEEILSSGTDGDGNPSIWIDSSSLCSGNNCENPYALHDFTLPNGQYNLIQIINQPENYDKDLTFNLPSSSGTFALISQIPTLEPMANVDAMLTSFGLNASANLAPAQAGTAEVGKAVVQ